jgi:hypothetical protein
MKLLLDEFFDLGGSFDSVIVWKKFADKFANLCNPDKLDEDDMGCCSILVVI